MYNAESPLGKYWNITDKIKIKQTIIIIGIDKGKRYKILDCKIVNILVYDNNE